MDAIITVPQNLAIDIQKIATHYRKDFQDASLLALRFGVKEVLEGISSFEIPRTSGRPARTQKPEKVCEIRVQPIPKPIPPRLEPRLKVESEPARQTAFSHIFACSVCGKDFEVDHDDYARVRLSTLRGIKPRCTPCGGVGGLPPV